MEVAIIIALKDQAAVNIKNNLLKHYQFKATHHFHTLELKDHILNMHQFDSDSIFLEDIDKDIKADIFVFATKHQSASGINSLSVHSPGNWGVAKYGGKDRELCISPPNILKASLKILEKKADHSKYEVVQEVTHHGPYLEKPCMFIEIGSSLERWQDVEAGKIIADTIIETFSNEIKEYETAVGIGGLHTAPNFKKIMLGNKYSVGHICPKYMLENFTKEMLMQALERTTPKANLVILDWKGLKDKKQEIIKMLEDLGVRFDRTDKF